MLSHIILYAGVLPFITAACVALVILRTGALPEAACALGVAAGFIAAQFGTKARGGFDSAWRAFTHPLDASDWLPAIALLALGVTLIGLLVSRRQRWVPIALAAFLATAAPVRLLTGNVAQEWPPVSRLLYLALFASTFGTVWWLHSLNHDHEPGLNRPFFVAALAAGVAATLAMSGVLTYGILAGAIAASLAGVTLPCVWNATSFAGARAESRPALQGFTGAAGVITCLTVGLILLGHFFASLSGINAVLLLLALAVAGAPFPAAFATQPQWSQISIRGLLCLTPLALALASAAASDQHPY